MSHVEFSTRNADAVGVFRVVAITGELSARRDWVFSRVEAEVVDVLKQDSGQRVAPGRPTIQFSVSGGAATVASQHIDAVVSRVKPLTVGATYLLSLESLSDGRLFASDPSFQYEVVDSRLDAVELRSGLAVLHGMQVSDAAERIRAASGLEAVVPTAQVAADEGRTRTLVGVLSVSPSAFQETNWSGNWTSRNSQDLEIVRSAPGTGTARGWSALVERLGASHDYVITIEQTSSTIVVTFPGGTNNMLTIPGLELGEGSHATVIDRGNWWTKHVTSARWAGSALELASTTFSGWWKDGAPEGAQPKPTDFRKRLTLTHGTHPDLLLLRVQLADEKGELEYVQKFYRQP